MNITVTDFTICNGPIAFETIGGAGSPITLPLDGVLDVVATTGASFVLATGQTLRGLRWLDDLGSPITDTIDEDDEPFCMIRAEPGGVITISHNDGSVPADERIATTWGLDVLVGPNRVQCWLVHNGSGWASDAPDWTAWASGVPYSPATPADWSGSPTTAADALDRLAAAVAGLLAASIP
jgi:hypothetical protein